MIEIDSPSIDDNSLTQPKVISSHKFATILDILFSFQKFPLRYSRILMFLFINWDRVILEIEKDLNFSISLILTFGFNHTLLKIPIETQHVSVEMYPIRLVQLRGIFIYIFGVKVIMGCGDQCFIIDHRFLECFLSW